MWELNQKFPGISQCFHTECKKKSKWQTWPLSHRWAIYIAEYRLTTIIGLSGHILVYMLHWNCAIHQKWYCCYIVEVPFTQKLYCYYIVILSFTKNFIVVILELCHSPKIVMLLHRRGYRIFWVWTGTTKNWKNIDFAGNSPNNAHFVGISLQKRRFWRKIIKNCQFSDQKYVLLLYWSCVIHQKLYCCYIGSGPFSKNCIVVTLDILCKNFKKMLFQVGVT